MQRSQRSGTRKRTTITTKTIAELCTDNPIAHHYRALMDKADNRQQLIDLLNALQTSAMHTADRDILAAYAGDIISRRR